MELMESLLDGSGNGEIVEFDEEVGGLIQSEALGIGAQGSEIFEAQMKITASRDGEAVSEAGLKFIAAGANQFGVERIFVAGVRGGNHVSDAVGDGHFGHLEGNFQRCGAVVKARKKVAMDIDHYFR